MLKCRKSQGHVELILSFFIFVSFVIVIFFFINPIKQQTTSYVILDKTQDKMLNVLSTDIQYVPIIMNISLVSGAQRDIGMCFEINNSYNIGEGSIVRDNNGNVVKSVNQNNKFYIENKSSQVYNLYLNNIFNDYPLSNPSSCTVLNDGEYSYGVLGTDRKILYENMVNFDSKYVSSYSLLKNELGLMNDFEFVVYNLTRAVLMDDSLSVHRIRSRQVLSREIPLRVMDKNATEFDIILSLRAW